MAAELQSTCKLFDIAQMNNCHAVAIRLNTSDTADSSNNIVLKAGLWYALNHFWDSMDNFSDCYNKDSVRKTMLQHEQIFKDQVNELHRVYKVQKSLMTEIRSEELRLKSAPAVSPSLLIGSKVINRRSESNSSTSHSSPLSYMNQFTQQLNFENGSLNDRKREGPSSRELSISSQEPHRVLKEFDLEQPVKEYTPKQAKAICNETRIFGKQLKEKPTIDSSQKWFDNESSLELTLSIGCRKETSRSSNHQHSKSDAD